MPPIQSFAEFDAALATAIAGMNRLVMENPGDSFLESIRRQLKFVFDWTRGSNKPTEEQLEKLTFGVMATRAVDDLDPDLGLVLHRLSSFLKHWK